MCGIFGCAASTDVASLVLRGIKRLEYRGYDSVGMATLSESRISVRKGVGFISEVSDKLHFCDMKGKLGIAHTRWSTHGGVTKENSHPHLSCNGDIVIAHNGIIENYQDLKAFLERQGHKFRSETDSEVVAHYFEEKLKGGKDVQSAIPDFLEDVKGTFAVLLMAKGDETVYAIKRDSPLVLGICKDRHILASDIYAFSDITDKAVFFEDDEFAVVKPEGYVFFGKDGSPLEKEVKTFIWKQEESAKKEYRHFMQKEIEEEPVVASRMLLSLEHEQKKDFEKLVALMRKARRIIFAACGTSYFASLLGAYYLHGAGVEAQTLIASEFKNYANIDEHTLVIALSQSGETMDVIDALKYAEEREATVASIVNVPYCTIQRMSSVSLNTLAGQEVAVASTKAFVNAVVFMLRLAQEFGFKADLSSLPDEIRQVLSGKGILERMARTISRSKDCYVIGRGAGYPVAREIALKMKEITYIHAEGMMGGELKHGTIALIEKGTPVISIAGTHDPDILSNTKEVEARGARVVLITNDPANRDKKDTVFIDTDNDGKFGILACVAGQLLAYYTADALGREIDKPRNLAKSVTVK